MNQEFVKLLREKDRSSRSDASPRKIMNSFFFKPPFGLSPKGEENLLEAILETRVGDEHYPGSMMESPNWRGVAPGELGMNNAISPKFTNLKAFTQIETKPPALWIRGADDQVVSDTSLFDLGYLGQLGAIPGWPGLELFPPQPMVPQIRALLEYRESGGEFVEVIVEDCGHSPHLEKPEEFNKSFHSLLKRA